MGGDKPLSSNARQTWKGPSVERKARRALRRGRAGQGRVGHGGSVKPRGGGLDVETTSLDFVIWRERGGEFNLRFRFRFRFGSREG